MASIPDGLLALIFYPLDYLIQVFITIFLGIFVLIPAFTVAILTKGPKVFKKTHGIYSALRDWPGGSFIFLKLVAFIAPYSGSIGGNIEFLEPGVCKAHMDDRPWLRNPFSSVHAIALVNFAELTSGLAVMTAIETVKGAIGIPVKISIVYHAKARGRVYCRANLPQSIPTVPGLYYVHFKPSIISSSSFFHTDDPNTNNTHNPC
jgi:hypothetical protein